MPTKSYKSFATLLVAVLYNAVVAHASPEAVRSPHRVPPKNILDDSSFEDADTSRWSATERKTLWSAERVELPVDCGVARSGRCSVRLGGLDKPSGNRAVFVSQRVDWTTSMPPPSTASRRTSTAATPFRLSFWSRGQTPAFRVQLDVAYRDQTLFTVAVRPKEDRGGEAASEQLQDGFSRTCVDVPNYGRIRAMMLHLVVEGDRSGDVVHVDDVSIEPADVPDDACPLYVDSFPRRRHVVVDFLRPDNPKDCLQTLVDPAGESSENRLEALGVTLATQMTVDRLPTLAAVAAIWNGPISATVLVYGDGAQGTDASSTLRTVVDAYFRSPAMRRCVRLHVVHADAANPGQDVVRYPVNFLRNVAIAHARTSHVFYVDVDVVPMFSEPDARRWIAAVDDDDDTPRRAFIVPIFNSKSPDIDGLPRTKSDVLDRIRRPESGIEPFLVVSHSIVQYQRWYDADAPYQVQYRPDVEPYFIARTTAPVMSDLFAGYGRDKCAYIRDLNATGHEFFVLPSAFAVNVAERRGSRTIYDRSGGVRLDMFFSVAFHTADLAVGFVRYPKDYDFGAAAAREHDEAAAGDDGTSDDDADLDDQATCSEESCDEIVIDDDLYGRHDDAPPKAVDVSVTETSTSSPTSDIVFDDLPQLPEVTTSHPGQPGRFDTTVECLMIVYGVRTYVEVGELLVRRQVDLMLPFMHPDAAIAVQPHDDVDDRFVSGLFEVYRGRGNLTTVLDAVGSHHPGRKLYSLDVTAKLLEGRFVEYVEALMARSTDDDVILVSDQTGSSLQTGTALSVINSTAGRLRPGWKLYRRFEYLVVKAEGLKAPPPAVIPSLPVCPSPSQAKTEPHIAVDILLMTKNRPMQTFAFLESLSMFVTGVSTVWIALKSEGSQFDDGYQLAQRCFSNSVRVELVREPDSGSGFGKTIMDVLRTRSTASHVILAVDELIWLRTVDVVQIAQQHLGHCHTGQDSDEFYSVQLRLGNNIRSLKSLPDADQRFHPLTDGQPEDDTLYAFYPRGLPYDFGYILHVDAVLARRRDLINDHEESGTERCSTPGCLETGWMRRLLHRRSRQWQLTFGASRTGNNMMEDGRVAGRSGEPSEESRKLAERLVEQKQKIDVKAFVDKNGKPSAVHTRLPVDYTTLGPC